MKIEEILNDVESTYNCRLTFNDVSEALEMVVKYGYVDDKALKLLEALLRLRACNLV